MHSPRIGPNLAGELLSELLSYSVVLWVRTGNDSREDWTKFCRAGGSPKIWSNPVCMRNMADVFNFMRMSPLVYMCVCTLHIITSSIYIYAYGNCARAYVQNSVSITVATCLRGNALIRTNGGKSEK